ncbi:transketolase C-terminal domain-containing protein [Mesorhizobium sp.]|uniref:transketolase C-terminal domain-containing protein n=1 Tax=Mesorhizobium sp. TaxID=1871066 RepID=UPI0025E02440|nr:transketolase C-terminal domain-containing protein [Mesorhizobium sp.]
MIEARGLYQVKAPVELTDGAEPVGKARLRREGGDLVIVTWGTMVQSALLAADDLKTKGIEASVLDLRWLNPLDEHSVSEAVGNAGSRVLIVHEAVRTGGFAGEITMRIRELLLHDDLKIYRLTTPDVRMPASPRLQAGLIPDRNSIVTAAKALLSR